MQYVYLFCALALMFFVNSIEAQNGKPVNPPRVEDAATTTQSRNVKKDSLDAENLDEVVVTASRENDNPRDLPMAIEKIGGRAIKDTKPTHPSEIMNQAPGVFVNTTSGEGHQMMIRHPLTTGSVYLYLEDGVPSRSPGFYNHNALFELNVPQAGAIEIIKGPGSALYGSDAIGGVINVLTRPVLKDREIDLSFEYGGFGFKRLLASVGEKFGEHTLRIDGNMTDSAGWRNSTNYTRQSGTLRWEFAAGKHRLKTVVAASNIDQQSAGAAALREVDYLNGPQANYMPFSFRKVKAVRVSTQYDYSVSEVQKISAIAYARYDEMGQIPNYIGVQPAQRENNLKNGSVGMLFKHLLDIRLFDSKIISGLDADYSPGSYLEWAVATTKTGDYFTAYSKNALQYDYGVSFYQASPFVQIESSPFTRRLKLHAGVRYDYLGYVYSNNLSVLQTGAARRPGDAAPRFDHLSPKAGVVYDFFPELNLFVSYRHGFRVPQQSDLFRQGGANSALGVKPIKVDSFEVGVRGALWGERVRYEATGFYAEKKDDILSVSLAPGVFETQNAGATSHRGVELGLNAEVFHKILWVSANATYAEHRYVDWSPAFGVTLDGNTLPQAPALFGTVSFRIVPVAGLSVAPEWVYLGKYFMDDRNTTTYPGHSLFNVRVKYDINERFSAFARFHNITNVRYADIASYNSLQAGTYPGYVPGEPLSLIAGIQYSL